jgi:2-oxo-4-hydroxy-4-carboxy-5-ureidoimidazoline decarboxylase
VIESLADANRAYEQGMGFTYIVYATGKSAEEMLVIARDRLTNSRDEEIVNASKEQMAITRTRLRRMLCMGDDR